MVKCVMVCLKTKCAPSQHLRQLNPHLEHAQFTAFYATEACDYKFRQGHCQVSSFGVGGTNGHAIFWGTDVMTQKKNPVAMLIQRYESCRPPVIADGPNPENWEYNG